VVREPGIPAAAKSRRASKTVRPRGFKSRGRTDDSQLPNRHLSLPRLKRADSVASRLAGGIGNLERPLRIFQPVLHRANLLFGNFRHVIEGIHAIIGNLMYTPCSDLANVGRLARIGEYSESWPLCGCPPTTNDLSRRELSEPEMRISHSTTGGAKSCATVMNSRFPKRQPR